VVAEKDGDGGLPHSGNDNVTQAESEANNPVTDETPRHFNNMAFKVGDHVFEGEESSCPGKIIDFYTNSNDAPACFLGLLKHLGC
jgi:hypothetical protein